MSKTNLHVDDDAIIAATRNWLEKAVIGLNLCPFAKAVHVKQQVRYVVSSATTPEQLLETLMDELQLLSDTDPEKVDTTLLIHPFVLTDFIDYNEFLDVADAAVEDMQLDGELQVASFHPDYQFADTDINDIGNFTNRSPYPTLHLLREDSIEKAVEAFPEASDIFEKNIATLEQLGHEGWDKLDVGPANEGGVTAGPALPERPDTPCVAVCSTTFDEICRGCGRSVVEVAHWVSMSAEAKEAVWVRILAQGYPRRNS